MKIPRVYDLYNTPFRVFTAKCNVAFSQKMRKSVDDGYMGYFWICDKSIYAEPFRIYIINRTALIESRWWFAF